MAFSVSKEFVTRSLTALGLVLLFIAAACESSGILLVSMLLVALFILITREWPQLMAPHHPLLALLLTPFYPVMPFLTLMHMAYRFIGQDPVLALYSFTMAWTADTAGYLVGKQIGKHKVCPSISPGKSWEGLIGSFCAVMIVHALLAPYSSTLKLHPWLMQPTIVVVTALAFTALGFMGGMFASVLKRRAGLKDSGQVLPGHGGILDRFDSVLFIAPIIWLTLLFLQLYD